MTMAPPPRKPVLPPMAKAEAPPSPAPTGALNTLKSKFLGASAKPAVKSRFALPEVTADVVNEQVEWSRVNRMMRRLTFQAVVIAGFACLLAVGAPFFAPIYVYHTQTPEGKVSLIVPLDLPNLTNPAVVQWAANSVTEIMSFGFGDVIAKTLLQQKRFTKSGWEAFKVAFQNSKINETFKKSQMVMTTVPTDTPVVVSQGVNEDGVYEWKLEVPLITTFAGNDDAVRPVPGLIEMTIVRVSPDENPAGIAIDIWRQIKH